MDAGVTIVDLSAPIENSSQELPEPFRTEIEFSGHAAGAQMCEQMLGVTPDLLRDGEAWATEEIRRLGTHNSTHVDAPWHYNSRIRGERAQTIDELPLEWFLAPGVVIDATAKADGEAIDVPDFEAGLNAAGHTVAPLDIVLVRTGRDTFYSELDYIGRGPAVTAGATRWLFDQGVRVMGIDAWGWDGPLYIQAEAAKEAGKPGIFWAAHQSDLPYSQIERLFNLGALPLRGFQVACFPLKIVGASAAPARVVAILPDQVT
jgi:kynurenine formamidase